MSTLPPLEKFLRTPMHSVAVIIIVTSTIHLQWGEWESSNRRQDERNRKRLRSTDANGAQSLFATCRVRVNCSLPPYAMLVKAKKCSTFHHPQHVLHSLYCSSI